MKLIQILALATAMATMATAQNSGANSEPQGTPTPAAATKTSGTAKPAAKKAASSGQKSDGKTPAGTPAKASNNNAAAPKADSAAKGGTASGAAAKPTVKTTTVPVKAQPPAGTQAKATPTPVVANSGAKATATKKTEAKKTDTKKAPEAKVPFVSPIVSKDGISRPAPNCTSGKRCLVIPELVLQGTVKDTSGKMMAVVANSIKKTYFLRENDQVFQGSVEKITSDSIIFREYVKDALGRETAREVVKKLVPPS